MTAIDLIMCAISIAAAIGLCAVLILSFLLARPIYKMDAKMAERAKKLGYGG